MDKYMCNWPYNVLVCASVQKRHRMIEKQNDLKEVIVHLRTPTGTAPGPRDLSGEERERAMLLPPRDSV